MNLIKETVNKNKERYQSVTWREHPSLIGWCSMNYPRVLMDPRLRYKPPAKEFNQEDMQFLYQKKPASQMETRLFKPFSNFENGKNIFETDKVLVPPRGFKKSIATLTTTPLETVLKIREEADKEINALSAVVPIKAEYTRSIHQPDFGKRIKQIGEVNLDIQYPSEEVRHLQKLPNHIITEQNLIEVLNEDLLQLDLSKQTWVRKEIFMKMGFFAKNLEFISLTKTLIDDAALLELGNLCQNLKGVDISGCVNITKAGLKQFLKEKPELEILRTGDNPLAVTDDSLAPLATMEKLKGLSIAYCKSVTDKVLDYLLESGCHLTELNLSGTVNLSMKKLKGIFLNAQNTIEVIDISQANFADASNEWLQKAGNSEKMRYISLGGCPQITDDSINAFLQGDRDENGNRLRTKDFELLSVVRLNGIKTLMDGGLLRICQACPRIEFLDLNCCSNLTNHSVDHALSNLANLKTICLDMIPGVTPDLIEKHTKVKPDLKVVRSRLALSDPTDFGFRVPHLMTYTAVSKKKKKKDKKKKK